MFRKLTLGLFVAFAGTASQAAFIQCIPIESPVIAAGVVVPGGANFTCSPGAGVGVGSADDNLAGDGWDVTSLRLRLSGVFSDNNSPPGTMFSVTYTVDNESSPWFNAIGLSTVASGTSDNDNQALGAASSTTAAFAIPMLDFVPSFTVNVSGMPGSASTPFQASASVFYDVTAVQRPTQDIPEPGSMALVGLALAGLGLARRRKA